MHHQTATSPSPLLAASDTAGFFHLFQTNPLLAIVSLGLGVLVAVLLFKLFFDDWSDFWECVRFWFTPDLISAFRGEWAEDQWGTMKLFVWLAISVGTMILAFYQLPDLFPHLFHKGA